MNGIADPKIGVAFGGGAARGMSHVAFMEAMDELGVKPDRIAGTSIGALLGAGWAGGLSGREIRKYSLKYLGTKRSIIGRIWKTRLKKPSAVLRNSISMQLDACEVITSFLPDEVPKKFEELKTPLYTLSTDFKSWQQVVFRAGELVPAIAASIAIPSVFKPVEHAGRLLIDGSVSNPLPLDVAGRNMDILVAIDVNGSPSEWPEGDEPSLIEVGLGSAQILMNGLISDKLATFPPDVYARPRIEQFRSLEFWRVREIIKSGARDKEFFKRQLHDSIEKFISGQKKTP